MPVFNGMPFLEEALTSVLAQSLVDFECVVVDDGSTDNTPDLLAQFARRDSRVRVISCPRAGIVSALNTGVKAARAPLIARLDADDVCHKERLSKQVAFLADHPDVGLVASTVVYEGDAQANRGFALFVDWNNRLLDTDRINLSRFVETPVVHPTVCFRRAWFERFGPYRDDGMPEDYALWLRMLEGGVRFVKLAEPLVRWRDRPDRLSRRDPRCSPLAFARCKAMFLARWLRREASGKPVYIWGAGRTTRKRAECLNEWGIQFQAFVDIDPHKIGQIVKGVPVIAPDDLPSRDEAVVLSYVSSRGARDKIREDLLARDYREGSDFWMAG